MDSLGYDLPDGSRVIVQFDMDCTGLATWKTVYKNDCLVEVDASIEEVQNEVAVWRADDPYIVIDDKVFSYMAICFLLERLVIQRIAYLMEEKIEDLELEELLIIEKVLKNGG